MDEIEATVTRVVYGPKGGATCAAVVHFMRRNDEETYAVEIRGVSGPGETAVPPMVQVAHSMTYEGATRIAVEATRSLMKLHETIALANEYERAAQR